MNKVLLFVAIWAADIYTKQRYTTFDGAYHHRSYLWLFTAVSFIGVLAFILKYSNVYFLGPLIIIAASSANVLDAITNGMYVHNPFVLLYGNMFLAFNLADVMLVLGFLMCVVDVVSKKLRLSISVT